MPDTTVSGTGDLWHDANQAMQRHDWPTAIAALAAMRAIDPNEAIAYEMGARSLASAGELTEADSLAVSGAARFPDHLAISILSAELAMRRADWNAADSRWSDVRGINPSNIEAYTAAALARINLGRFNDADALLRDAVGRFPGAFAPAREYAWAAFRRQDWPAAENRFAALRAAFPGEREAYIGASLVLEAQSRVMDALELLAEGMRQCPNDPGPGLHRADVATASWSQSPDFKPIAIRCIAELQDRFPEHLPAFLLELRAYRRAGDLAAAEDIATQLLQRWPDNLEILTEQAGIAAALGKTAAAEGHLLALKTLMPNVPDAFLGLAAIYRDTGRFDDAEAVLEEAMHQMPTVAALFTDYAALADRRMDGRASVQRWADAARRFPAEQWIAHREQEARLRLIAEDPSVAEQIAVLNPTAELLMRFESLGGADAQGCEFGVFQRAFGAEPRGLLRWASLEPDQLIAALNARFDGVGLGDHTRISTQFFDNREEFVTEDTRFGMRMHTFLAVSDIQVDKAAVQLTRRLRFLTQKLIADLENGEKIFVYRKLSRDLTDPELTGLRCAMAADGAPVLFYIRYATSEKPPGTIEWAGDGLLSGYIERFEFDREGRYIGAVNEAWLTLCQRAIERIAEHQG